MHLQKLHCVQFANTRTVKYLIPHRILSHTKNLVPFWLFLAVKTKDEQH